MGRKWIGILTCLGILAAFLAVTLPVNSRIREIREQEQTIAALRERMESLDGEEITMQWNLCRWYNRNLNSLEPERYFRTAYSSILNLGEGMMGLLEVPKLGLCIPITHGADGAAGHDPDSALPIGGRGNHTVLYLEKACIWTEGTEVRLRIPGQERYYRVESIHVMPGGWSTECPSPVEMLILVFDGQNTRTIIRCELVNKSIYTFQASANP